MLDAKKVQAAVKLWETTGFISHEYSLTEADEIRRRCFVLLQARQDNARNKASLYLLSRPH